MRFGSLNRWPLAPALALMLAGCESSRAPPTPIAPRATATAPAPEDLDEATPQPQPNSQIFPGTGRLVGRSSASSRIAATDGDITLNFVNADLKDVAKAVLGDYLKLNYEIAGTVQGTVTLQTSTPLTKAQVLPALEEALKTSGMALVHSNGIYKVVPMADAAHTASAIASDHELAGFGTESVPVHFVSAVEMQKLLDPLAPAPGMLRADPERNLVIIEGTAEERKVIRDDIALFDVDWMQGMSFALFTPNYTDARELAGELNQVLGGMNSPILGVVRLVPIDRLNTILAVSPQVRYLNQMRAWVERLDKPGQGSGRRIFVYHVQNGRASDVASTLAKALFGNGAQNAAPGAPQSPQASLESTPAGTSTHETPGSTAPQPESASASAPAESTSYSGTLAQAGGRTGGVNITADTANNALVVYATPTEYGVIHSALRQLDTPPTQVFLEAAIAEITLTNNLHFGVQYFSQPNTQNQIVLSTGSGATISATYPGFSYMFLNGNSIQATLSALSTVTKVDVISSPELMVLNNQTATLEVGNRVPIETQQSISTITSSPQIVNSIEYEDTGVILKLTPRVNRGGVVMMDISQEVSDVTSTTSSNLDSPTIEERKITSSVAVQDGQTVALGGLISSDKSNTRGGIPGLSSIPVVGALFADTENDYTKTELMVLITPHVVDNADKARAITDELRRKLPDVESLVESVH